jgi:hypothetical protein
MSCISKVQRVGDGRNIAQHNMISSLSSSKLLIPALMMG